MNKEILELEKYALKKGIPIMDNDSIEYIVRRIKLFGLNKILEIGTAVGYSTIRFALANDKVNITSIEKDNSRFIEAVKNVNKFNLKNRVELVFNDALTIDIKEKFNLIIIDAAKGQNINFFEKYRKNLLDNGFIIVDNMNFHGMVGKSDKIENKNVKALVRKIEDFIEYLEKVQGFYIEYLNIGDGLAVCQKKSGT